MSLRDELVIIGPVAYQGKKGCQDARCRHFFVDGKMSEDCHGWHCSYCDEPCGSQGHRCDAARAVLDASEAVLCEQGLIPPDSGVRS